MAFCKRCFAERYAGPIEWTFIDGQGHSLDTLNAALLKEGFEYSPSSREFLRSKLYAILNDRAYLGDVRFRGQWCAGSHEPLIDRTTWDRVQTLLGGEIYRTHELTFACEFIRCGFCGRPVTGERKIKHTKHGEQAYVYYRCTRYNTDGHPRLRVREADLDREIISLFERIRIKDKKSQRWFRDVMRARLKDGAKADETRLSEVRRQLSSLQQQCDRLFNMRLGHEIDEATFTSKSTELRDRIARLESEAASHSDKQRSDTAEKLFELSQTLTDKWLSAIEQNPLCDRARP
jgi:hypothetical protein